MLMRLFLLTIFLISKFSFSQNESTKLLYVDMSVDYENYYSEIFNFIESNLERKLLLLFLTEVSLTYKDYQAKII